MADLHSLYALADNQSFPASCLYVVATPIGNVLDISLRALYILSRVDAIACEDTRNSAQLLGQLGITKPLIASHQHNENEAAQKIIQRLRDGQSIAMISDAGTPAVSDPGARTVDAVRAAGFRVVPLPGASAAVTALSASGLMQDQFHFVGFLPSKAAQRDTVLKSLLASNATLVFYEAPHRILDTVQAMQAVFPPERQIVLGRELTKLFEEIHRCALSAAADWLRDGAHRQKGEFVVLIEGASASQDVEQAEAQRVLSILLQDCSVKLAAQLAAQITGQKKNALYQLALAMHGNHHDDDA